MPDVWGVEILIVNNSKPIFDIPVNQLNEYGNVAVLIPCLNEEKTIEKVVTDFSKALAGARIFVFDNNSTDNTASIAQSNGAIVVHAPSQGKGYVVRQMFDQIDAGNSIVHYFPPVCSHSRIVFR